MGRPRQDAACAKAGYGTQERRVQCQDQGPTPQPGQEGHPEGPRIAPELHWNDPAEDQEGLDAEWQTLQWQKAQAQVTGRYAQRDQVRDIR